MCMSVSQLKITFGDSDRCVPDCRGAARLKSGLLRPRGSTRASVSGDDGTGESDIRGSPRERRRNCHSLSREGDERGEVTHIQMPSGAVHYPCSGPPSTRQRLMKNGFHYELDPSWSELLTPVSYKCARPPPPPLLRCPDLLTCHAHLHTCFHFDNMPRYPFDFPGAHLD